MAARRSDGEPDDQEHLLGREEDDPQRPARRGRPARPRPLTRIRLRPPLPAGPGARRRRPRGRRRPTRPSTRARSAAPADRARRRRGPVRAAPGQQDHRLEQARLAGRVRARRRGAARAERGVERRVAAEVGATVPSRIGRAVGPAVAPAAAVGGGPDRHDHVDVVVVADRLEDARRERAVELEGELVGVDVGQHVGEVARVERDRRAVALDRGLDLADVVADLGVGADGDPGLAVATDLELDDVGRLVGDQGGRADGPQQLLAIEDGPRRVGLRARPAGSSGTGRRSAG